MAAGDRHLPDWRDEAAYHQLLKADRSLLAWEWLRRAPGYRAAAYAAIEGRQGCRGKGPNEAAGRWGLHVFIPPHLAVPAARPVWSADAWPFVLEAEAGAGEGEEAFDATRFASMSTLVGGADNREHLLISDGLRVVRLDIVSGTLSKGPVVLRYRLCGLAGAQAPLRSLGRFLALCRNGRFSETLHPPEERAARFILALRASDALASGASQRAIAAEFFGKEASEANWRAGTPFLRSRAQRLVRSARFMASGGYLSLLRA